MLPAFEKVVPPPGRSLAWDTFDLAAFPYRWHFHPEFELTLITAGRGRRFVGDSIEPFEPGDLVLLGPHLPHTWHSVPARGERSSAVVVRFGPDVLGAGFLERAECGRLRQLMATAGRGLVFSGREAREVRDRMLGLATAAPLERLLALPALLDRLADHGKPRPLSSLEWDAAPPSRDARRIDRACRHIMQHFTEPLSLAAVAAVAKLSPAGFSRFFHRMTGRTFVGWLTEVRIGHACRLLVQTDQPVLEIAIDSGFGNLSNFNRAFRRLRGRTPREWRRAQRTRLAAGKSPAPLLHFRRPINRYSPASAATTMPFCDDSFLLSNPVAADLYQRVAAPQPIVDYHCHLSPRDIAEDRRFENLHAVWLDGDHYKWRAMRANGVAEDLITGSAAPREKFAAWAATVPHTLRNPLFHWTHLELRRHFGIDDLLEPASAERIWQEANRQLATGDLTARGILARMKVEVVGTTDDPADSLEWHEAIRRGQASAGSAFATRVVPTFRPDAALKVRRPDVLQPWVKRLSDAAGVGADTFAGLRAALERRHADFGAAGCRATDHGIEYLADADCTDAEAQVIWDRAIAGTAATAAEAERFTVWLMRLVARLNHEKGWVTQLHLGPFRDPNPLLAARLGADAGCDTIGDARQGPGLVRFLGGLAAENSLGRTILYNINPADNALFAAMPGSFQDGATPGKIQWGSGWWFMDQERGMRDQMNMLSDLGLLSRFVGMVTDSRSFLSYPRHEYFRRILCDLVGADVASGRLPDRRDWLERLVADVSCGNARSLFGFASPPTRHQAG